MSTVLAVGDDVCPDVFIVFRLGENKPGAGVQLLFPHGKGKLPIAVRALSGLRLRR